MRKSDQKMSSLLVAASIVTIVVLSCTVDIEAEVTAGCLISRAGKKATTITTTALSKTSNCNIKKKTFHKTAFLWSGLNDMSSSAHKSQRNILYRGAQLERPILPMSWRRLIGRHTVANNHKSMLLLLPTKAGIQANFLSNQLNQLDHSNIRQRQPLVLRQQLPVFQKSGENLEDISLFDGHHSKATNSMMTKTVTDAFNEDMRRMLRSRQCNFDAFLVRMNRRAVSSNHVHYFNDRYSAASEDSLEKDSNDIRWQRRTKPIVLDKTMADLDGANRALSMLRHMQSINAATEKSYQIVMHAFLNRGRLRWIPSSSSSFADFTAAKRITSGNGGDAVTICAADQLEELLSELENGIGVPSNDCTKEYLKNSGSTKVSLATYNLVLEAYACCSTPRGARNYASRADALFQRMQNINHTNSICSDAADNKPAEIATAMLHVCQAYSWGQANLQGSGEYARRSHEYLQQIIAQTTNPIIIRRAHAYVIEAYSKSLSPNSAIEADRLLQTAKSYSIFQSNVSTVDAEMYSNAILAWSKASATRSSFQNNVQNHEYHQHHQDQQQHQNLAQNFFAAATRAEELLREMLTVLFSESSPELSFSRTLAPSIAFNGAITAWARAGRPDRAERILWMMLGHYTKKDKEEYFNQTINALSLPLLLENASIYNPKCAPDAISFNTVLHCYYVKIQHNTKNKHQQLSYFRKVQSLVQYMEDNCHNQPSISPNCFTYNTLLKCYIQQASSNRDIMFLNELAEKAEQILHKMELLWERKKGGGDTSLEPTNRIFNMVLNAYAKSSHREAAYKAYRLLQRMKRIGFVLDGNIDDTKLGSPDTSDHPHRRHHRSKSAFYSDKCRPDIISYTSVIECIASQTSSSSFWTNCNNDPLSAPELAEQLLEEVTALYNHEATKYHKTNAHTQTVDMNTATTSITATTNTIGINLMPNLRTYTMTIRALATHGGDPRRARNLLLQLLQRYRDSGYHPDLRPNTFPFNYVLNCAANVVGNATAKANAFQIAARTYQDMRSSSNSTTHLRTSTSTSASHASLYTVRPDEYTYAFWIKCCKNLLPDNDNNSSEDNSNSNSGACISELKRKCIVFAFEECKADGLVSNEVLSRLFQSIPTVLVYELIGMRPPIATLSSSSSFFTYALKSKNDSKGNSSPPPLASRMMSYRHLKIENLEKSWSRNIGKSTSTASF